MEVLVYTDNSSLIGRDVFRMGVKGYALHIFLEVNLIKLASSVFAITMVIGLSAFMISVSLNPSL